MVRAVSLPRGTALRAGIFSPTARVLVGGSTELIRLSFLSIPGKIMNDLLELIPRALLIGAGATVVMDVWGVLQKRVLGVQPLNYCLLGRWIGHFPRGQFVHENIARSPRVPGECPLGWGAHYGIGVAFATLLLAWWGLDWARNPTLGPALIVGIGTVVAPFFLMQPGMGAGIAASKTPRPTLARIRSLATHAVYGVGLYLSGCFWAALFPHA